MFTSLNTKVNNHFAKQASYQTAQYCCHIHTLLFNCILFPARIVAGVLFFGFLIGAVGEFLEVLKICALLTVSSLGFPNLPYCGSQLCPARSGGSYDSSNKCCRRVW